MKVGYSVVDRTVEQSGIQLDANLSTTQFGTPSPAEGAALFSVAIIGALGNIFVMIITLTCPKLRQMSSAFLFHHCLLDAIKSIFCLPFGYSLLMKHEIPHCDVVGAAYILLMTVSAYNLLALLINEEYQCSYTSKNNGDYSNNSKIGGFDDGGGGIRGEDGGQLLSSHTSRRANGDSCCIAFGVVIIWFTTVLLHLGVAFLPGSSEFSSDIGNCVYRYGITKNYVIHALWVILVTGAVVVAAFSFLHFYRKLRSQANSRKWTYLHKSLSSSLGQNQRNAQNQNQNPNQTMQNSFGVATSPRSAHSEEVHYEFFEDTVTQMAALQTHRYMRRLVILLLMLVSFVVCWYPLFLLTLFDVHYQQPPRLYRILMIVAWTHPLTTPVFCAIIYYDQGWGHYKEELYANAIPMTTSRSSHAMSPDFNHVGVGTGGVIGGGGGGISDGVGQLGGSTGNLTFFNQNFHWGNHTESPARQTTFFNEYPSSPGGVGHQHCETVTNYNVEEGACQTLIM